MVIKSANLTIDILLATYNGSRYISDFIESILDQSYNNWFLLISDDESQDETVSIINLYASKDARIRLVNTQKQGGIIQNFSKCLSYSSSPYIMFADQDDVWLPNKITLSLQTIAAIEAKRLEKYPILVFTDLKLVDENLNIIEQSFYRANNLNPVHNIHSSYLAWRSTVFGCSVIFNDSLKQKVGCIDHRVMMHDHIFALTASLFGEVVYLEQATVLYRQHSNNTIGGLSKSSFHKLKNLWYYLNALYRYRQKIINQLDYIHDRFSQDTILSRFSLSNIISRFFYVNHLILPYVQEKSMFTILLCIVLIIPHKSNQV